MTEPRPLFTPREPEHVASGPTPQLVEHHGPGDATEFSLLHRRGPWRDALRRRMLALADLLATTSAVGLVAAVGFVPVWSLALVPLWLVLAKLYGLYDNDHRALRHLTVDELPTTMAWTTTATALHLMLVSMVDANLALAPSGVRLWLLVMLLVPVSRAAARGLWRAWVPQEGALLIGSGPLEHATRRKLELFRDIHVSCIGALSDEANPLTGARLAKTLDDYREAGTPVDRVIVATPSVDELMIASLVQLCRKAHIKLSVVPPTRGMFGTAVQLRHIADLPLIEYSTWDVSHSTMLIKRAADIVLSTVLLILTAPLLAVIAIAVKVDSSGPALFTQLRAGQGGRPFRIYKFRTMTADAERRLGEVVDLEQLADPMFKLRMDPRITRLGRILRRASLDELPQLVNVWLGHMSLVGPRPEELMLVERYGPDHSFRLAVKPGLTGPMQVYGRGELSFEERLAVEREYVENLSVRRDLRIALLTIAAVFRGGGAF
jgi:exopolysaccharide biosynthesis polyprenyl glycosylphosphotransferase